LFDYVSGEVEIMNDSRLSGFTLIEVLIVLAVVAILAAIAFPAYMDQVRKARRSDAMGSLQEMQMAQEKWRANHTVYAAALMGENCGDGDAANDSGLCIPSTSEQGYYTLAITAASATGFTGTASPQGSQSRDSCGTFAIDQDGPVTAGYANAECWKR
jgi:type IV pilus assembly protein PilE